MGCCAASVRGPETSRQRTCCSCAFLGLRSPFCRSFKKIHNHHSNRQLRGTCGFPRLMRGLGAFDQGCGARHPNNDQSTACSHSPHHHPEPGKLARPAGGDALNQYVFCLRLSMWGRFGCSQGAEVQVLLVHALYAPNPCPHAVAILPRLAVLGEAGKLLLIVLASTLGDACAS